MILLHYTPILLHSCCTQLRLSPPQRAPVWRCPWPHPLFQLDQPALPDGALRHRSHRHRCRRLNWGETGTRDPDHGQRQTGALCGALARSIGAAPGALCGYRNGHRQRGVKQDQGAEPLAQPLVAYSLFIGSGGGIRTPDTRIMILLQRAIT